MRTPCLASWTVTGLVLLMAGVAPARAEIVKRVSLEGIYDNNTFKSADKQSDVVTQASAYLARRDTSAKSGVEYFYTGDIDLFVRSSDRLFTNHHVGVTYVRELGRELLSAGWNFGGRWNRANYDYYNNIDGSVYASLKLKLPGGSSLRPGYRLTLRKYLHLEASSFREHQASLAYNAPLPLRTALNADASYGYKGYTMDRLTGTPAGNAGSPDKRQVILSLRLSHSLRASTGVNAQYLRRINPTYGGRYQSGVGAGYGVDEDLFDDHYDYGGHEFSGGLSQLLPRGAKLTFEAGYAIRDYHGKPALDLNGLPLGKDRSDRRRHLSAEVSMPLGMTFDLNLWYLFMTNVSNDPFYNYRGNHAVSIGIGREF